MGYDLHISRRKDWADSTGPAITELEWRMLIDADRDLKIVDPLNNPNVAILGDEIWFDWSDGQVFTKNPDRQTLQKMLKIANRLGANVQGDDGEIYDLHSLDKFEESTHATKGAWIEYVRYFGIWIIAYILALILGIAIAIWSL
jgi:hypothetical protein